jgi:hypothetical protein
MEHVVDFDGQVHLQMRMDYRMKLGNEIVGASDFRRWREPAGAAPETVAAGDPGEGKRWEGMKTGRMVSCGPKRVKVRVVLDADRAVSRATLRTASLGGSSCLRWICASALQVQLGDARQPSRVT